MHLRRELKRIFLNETGQMTVFVALIFQVLFVFFAMVINIGLLVHDKINLQNAVDFGAYYMAQRQAEILNEIAHVNYQIHQDNKLLAWRYHVLGTLGRQVNEQPPATTQSSVTYTSTDAVTEIPAICVANQFWAEALQESSLEENYCSRTYGPGGTIPKIPPLTPIAPFVPGVLTGAFQIGVLQSQQQLALVHSGPLNWAFGAQLMMAYKMALVSRKSVIAKLRQNLVQNDFIDQLKQPVSNGVRTTILKNLTISNASTFENDGFSIVNGLANPACAGSNNDGDPTLREIRTAPLLVYSWDTQDSNGFQVFEALEDDTSHVAGEISTYDPGGILQSITASEPADPSLANIDGRLASSLGFEKNPWCMAWVGVHAKTKPRKPFAPFGAPVELTARSFAQPFGGRIGPWYKNMWAPGDSMSSGTRVDPLTSPRWVNNANVDGEPKSAQIPNYSRYPGDKLGMTSKAAQAAERGLIAGYGIKTSTLTYKYYSGFQSIPQTGDPLAWDTAAGETPAASPAVSNVRTAETIAVAPDLFDVTYYSIDPVYSTNYKNLNSDGTRFGDLGAIFGSKITVPPDIGGRNTSQALSTYDVQQQVQVANGSAPLGIDATLRNSALNYFIFDIKHILTGWAPAAVTTFTFPTARFAQCSHFADPHYMLPGGCTNGGRVGYSIRLISRDHLLSDKWNVGGAGQTGPILDPPATDF